MRVCAADARVADDLGSVEDAYGGQRVKMTAWLGRARLPVQVDVGIGDAVVPAPTVGVELTEADDGKTLKVVVTSADGRIAIGTAEPGMREIEVTFGDKPAPARPPAAKTKDTTEKRNWPKRTAK